MCSLLQSGRPNLQAVRRHAKWESHHDIAGGEGDRGAESHGCEGARGIGRRHYHRKTPRCFGSHCLVFPLAAPFLCRQREGGAKNKASRIGEASLFPLLAAYPSPFRAGFTTVTHSSSVGGQVKEASHFSLPLLIALFD